MSKFYRQIKRIPVVLLKELGCDKLQGYVIAKPMPFKDYLKWRSPNFTNDAKVGENLTLNFEANAK